MWRSRCSHETPDPTRPFLQPLPGVRSLREVGEHDVDQLAAGIVALEAVEKAQKCLVSMALYTLADPVPSSTLSAANQVVPAQR
jgi:hypothetical protein